MTGLRSIDVMTGVHRRTAAGPLKGSAGRRGRWAGPARRPILRGGLLSTTALVGAAALVWGGPIALAAPTGGTVVAGSATISTTGATTQITTNSQRTIINWQGLSIGPGETTKFVQPNASAATLNRVTGPDPSVLLGTLSSNGQVYLINPNGIVVGQGGRIDTAGFVASTLDVPNTAFMSGGSLKFAGTSTASIQNLGSINATLGDAVLVGQRIDNQGTVRAPLGTVGLAAGTQVLVTQGSAPQRVQVLAAGSVIGGGISNSGVVQAGAIELEAAPAPGETASAISNTGILQGQGVAGGPDGHVRIATQGGTLSVGGTVVSRQVDGSGGTISIDAGSGGTALVSGTVDASGLSGTLTLGGLVAITGANAGVMDGGRIDASGDAGGGTVKLGGGFQGRDPGIANAKATYVAPNATISADARTAGNGGQVTVWSDSYTNFRGRISARGDTKTGHGGTIEISSHGKLDFLGNVDLVAAARQFGTLLLDPLDLVVDTGGTSISGGGPNTTFVPTNPGSATTISPSSIETALATGNLVLKTTGTPAGTGQNGDITVNAAIDETQTTATVTTAGTLTLLAARNITINAPINVFGDLSLNATGGSVLVNAGASLSTANVAALANSFSQGDIPVTGGAIDTTASVNIRAANDITILANITSGLDGGLMVMAGGITAASSTLQSGPGIVQFGNASTNAIVTYVGGDGDVLILSGTKSTTPGARTNLNLLDFDHLVFTSANVNNTGSAIYRSIDIEGFGAVTPLSSVTLLDSSNLALPGTLVLNDGLAARNQITILASGNISLGQTNPTGLGNIILGPFATAAGTTLSLTSVTGNVTFSADIGAGGIITAKATAVDVPLDPAGLTGLTVINADTAQVAGGGTITESGAARIISGTFAGSAFAPTNLNNNNFVATLGAFSNAQGTLSLRNTIRASLGATGTTISANVTQSLSGLTIAGPVTSSGTAAGQTAGITITELNGSITVAGNVLESDGGGATANGVTLSGASITQNAGSTVDGGTGTVTLNANAGAAAINGRVHSAGTAPGTSPNAVSILGSTGVSQATGGVIDGGAGSVILDAGGGSSFNLAGTIQTTSAQDSGPAAIRIVDGVNAVLGTINAVNGTFIIGNSPTSISGTVSQTAGTAINAKALASHAEGNVTLTNSGNVVGTLSVSNNGTGRNFAFTDAAPAGGLTIGTANGQSGILIGTGTLALAASGANGSISEGAGAIISAAAASFNAPGGAILTNANSVAVIAALTNNAPFSFTDATDLTVGSVTLGASTLVGIGPPSAVTMVAPTVTLAQSVVASSLSITATATTGAGPLISQIGGTLDVSGDVTLVASLHPTLGGATVQVSTGNLTLGSSQVQGDLVLTDAASSATMTLPAGSTLAVAGNATLTASTIALNGTGVIGGNLVTNGVTSGATSFATGIGGTVFFSNGTFAPGGGATQPNFDIGQLVPAIGTLTNVTLNLSPILPSISASKGNTAISVARAGNHMGGTLAIQTGTVATSAGAVERDFNLVQAGGAVNFGTLNGGINFTVEAAAGTSFNAGGTSPVGSNTLNGGKGSTVALGNGSNTFRSLSLVDVSDSTIAGAGPLTIGGGAPADFVHGNLDVSMSGPGGITLANPLTASNVTRLAAPGTANSSTLSLGTGGGVTQQAGAPILAGTMIATAGAGIGLGDTVTVGELDLTGNGLIQQTGGTLTLGGTATGGSGNLNVTDLAAGDATLAGNTSSTLTLGNSSVTGDLVLKSGALLQPAGNTLVVGGNLDLTAVGAPITFNGTAIVGQDLLGTTPITGGLVAVGSLNRPQLAQGTIAPTFNNVSGANFTASQQMLDLARSGVGSAGTVTVQLFGALASQSLTATHGAAVQLSAAGNRIGGTAHVNTGNGTLTATAQVKDVNLRQASALSFVNTVGVVAHAGTSFGGTNTLNAGAGSTVLLDSGTNTFGTISFASVAGTTLDGTGGIVIGGSTLDGPLTVSMTGTGGITTSGAIAASNQTVTLSDLNDGITLGANLVAGALSLTGNGSIVQTGGTLSISGNVDVTDIAAGNASVAATASPGLLVGNSAVAGTLSLSAGNGQPLSIVPGATLQAANGDIALTGQTINLNNSTLIATGNLATTGTVTGTAVFAINGTNPVLTASGTIAASGAASDFTLTQAALSAAGGSIAATAPITVLLTNKQAAISGAAGTGKVSLANAGNSIGGTLRVNTGTVLNSGGIVTKYYNLVETAALNAGVHALSIIATAGTLFETGGTATPGLNTLNAGKGSTVSLTQGGNVMTAATLVDVSDTAIDVTGGITIGSAGQVNYVHGTLAVGASGALNVVSTIDASTAADGSNIGNTAAISLGSTGGTVAQSAGAVLETSLLTGAGTTVALNSANQVLNLGAFAASAGTLSFTDATALLVSGPVTGQNVTLVTAGAGSDMMLAGTVSAAVGQVTLTSSRSINQTAGAITAGTLTGSAAASAFLGDPTHLSNRVSTLGSFSSTGAFSLGNGATLTVAGPVTAAGSGGVVIADGAPVSLTGNVGSAASGGITVIGSTGTGQTNAITQTAASTLDGGAGVVLLDAGGTGSFNLAGSVVTTSALDAPGGAIDVVDGVIAILGTLTAHSGTVVLGSAAQPLTGTVAQSPGSRIDAKAVAVRDTDTTGTVALSAGGNLIGTIAVTSGGIALAVTDATDLAVGIANGVVGIDPPSSVVMIAPTVTVSQSVSAGSLNVTATATTGAGPLISQTGGTIDVSGDVTLVASLHPTLGGATVQTSTGNLTLGSSQVQGDFVLADGAIGATLTQPATSTLAVAGNAVLTASTLALNGTVLVGGALTTNGSSSGTGAIGSGISGTLAFSNGTFSPGNGAATPDFSLDAFGAGHAAFTSATEVTLNLSPTLPTLSATKGGGTAINVALLGNHIGGTLTVQTGTVVAGNGNPQQRNFNLVQASAVNLSTLALTVVASAGTSFGSSNSLNAGAGSTVSLLSGANSFGTLAFENVAATTVDGTGGIAIGASSVHGNLAVAMTGSGGISTTGAVSADNHTTIAPTNSAAITLTDQNDGVTLGGTVTAGTLNLTGNGTIVQTAGILTLAGDLNVTDLASGDATLTGNTLSTLTLGTSSVSNTLVLATNSLLQTAGNTLAVGGDLDLSNVGSATFNGTVAVGNNILGTNPISGGTIAVGGLNNPQLAHGTIGPTFGSVSGTTFLPSQGMVTAAQNGVGPTGAVTVQLFGTVASLTATPGAGRVILNQGGNSIGGVARIHTGATLTPTISAIDVNLGEAGALVFAKNALILAHPGTLFGGSNSLSGGLGSTVLLKQAGNTFAALALSGVADTTIDGSGNLTLGFAGQANTVHGNLSIAMGGGIALATVLTADNHTSLAVSNTAAVSLLADTAGGTAGIVLATSLTAASLQLVAAGEINQIGGTIDVSGNLGATNTGTLGDASVAVSTGNLTLGGSSVAGDLSVSDSAAGATLTQTGLLQVGGNATLSAPAGSVSLTGTVQVGGSFTGPSGGNVTTGLGATASLVFSNGTFSPGGGSPTNFDLATLVTVLNTQGSSNATLNLSPTLTGFTGVVHGVGIHLTQANHVGGTVALQTGDLALKTAQETDFNLVQSTGVSLAGKTLLVEANTGTAFGGSNTLNAGIGSTVSLLTGSNTFGTLAFSNLANTTVDATGGIVIAGSTFNGNFAVSLTGTGSILTTGAILADNHLGPDSASVTFSDTGDGVTLGAGVTAGTLNLTGNGTIKQTAGLLNLAGDLNVTDIAAGDATLTGNTAAGGGGTLALGTSSVTGNLVLSSNSLVQSGGSTLTVGGDLDLSSVPSSTFNGTVIVGNNLLGTHPVSGGTIAVGGLDNPQLAQGTIAPTFNNISGTTFRPTQGVLDAASAGVGPGGTVTLQLFGAVADRSLAATHGPGLVMLNAGGNSIGGAARINTGNGTLAANASSIDLNLGQVGALAFNDRALILAHPGTLFGGPNTLNAGRGSTVLLASLGNHFTAVALQDVSDSTLDGTGGVTIGFAGQTNIVHGNLLVSIATSGGISLASDLAASNVAVGSTLANSALVSLDASSGDIGLGANLVAGSLGLRGNGSIAQTGGTLGVAGNVTVVDIAAGDASVAATASPGLVVGDSAVVGTLSVSAGGANPLSLSPGATLQAANGDIVLTGQPINLNNGTLIVTGNLVTNGTVIGSAKFAVNGNNPVLLANGTVVASGGSSNFMLTQTAIDAAGTSIGLSAPITVLLTNSQAAISGTPGTGKVSLLSANNAIGGTLRVNTGTVLNSGGIVTKYFNLVQTAALGLGGHGLSILADPGTLFGGPNTLNAGKGSTVALDQGGNQFSTVQLQQVADSTIDAQGGVTIGTSTLHGNLAVSVTGSGGISTSGAILADNHTATQPNNTAVVTLDDEGDGIALGADVTAGTLNLTGNGSILQMAGVLTLAGDLNVADKQAGSATLSGNTAAGSGGTLSLGNSSVNGDLVLQANALLQPASDQAQGTKLVVGGTLDLTSVGSSAFNGTVIVGGDILGTHPVTGGTIAVGGLNHPQLAQGTIAPTFNSISGTTFTPSQAMLDAASSGVGSGGTITLQLFGVVADRSLNASGGGSQILLNQGGNRIGGVARIAAGTGAGTLTANAASRDVNLGEVSALDFATKALILAHPGTLFGGPNTLNAGRGSTVLLGSFGNTFASVELSDVSDTTLDGSGGITIGFPAQSNAIHGSLTVSMTGSGGIATAGAIVASNIAAGSTLANSAVVTLDDQDDGIALGANLSAGTLNLRGNGSIVQNAGTLALAGDLNVTDLAAGNATLGANTGASGTLNLGNSSVNGDLVLASRSLLQSAGTTLVVGGNLDLTNVGSATFNGTVAVGGDIAGTNPVSGSTIAVGGLNHPQLQQGTIAPTFNNVSGATFDPTQAMIDAAHSGVGSAGTITVQLFGPIADQSLAPSGGTGRVLLNQSGNTVGGVARVATGAGVGTLTATVSTRDVNLGEATSLAFSNNALIIARPGTLFGGPNGLDGGFGSSVLLDRAGNTFLGVAFSNPADTTIDGSSGITIGFGTQTNTVHGNLAVAMGGGISLATSLSADNHTGVSPTNSAAVSLVADTAGATGGITLAANLTSASLQLVAAGEINQTGGILDVAGNVGATNTGTLGDVSAAVSTGNLTLGGSTVAGNLLVSDNAAGATLTQTGALLVGGNATLSASTVSLTGTVQTGGSLSGASGAGVTTGLTSSLLFSNGTFSPGSGSPTDFDLVTLVTVLSSQGISNATLNLSPTLTGLVGVQHGVGINLSRANHIGGTLAVQTGSLTLTAGEARDFNLVQSTAVQLAGKTLLVEADPGTPFGGGNSLNGGAGSTVSLQSGTNTFGTLAFTDVAGTTLDGSGGITVGASSFHGNFALSMSGSGGIATAGVISADNSTSASPINTATVTLVDSGAGISIGGDIAAGSLALTGNGLIAQTAGGLDIAGDVAVTDTAQGLGDATVSANTSSPATLTLGGSSVAGDFVLTTSVLQQLASTTLAVGGNLDLSNVGSASLDGTAIVGQNLVGSNPVTGSVVVVGGLNQNLLAQGIVAPSFNNVSGLGTASPTFNLTQGNLGAAAPNGGLVTVQLFGILPNHTLTATHGQAVNLTQSGNRIGGAFTITTGPSLGSISLTTGDVNLGQSGALGTGSNIEILAHKGTSFGGSNTLNGGLGSFVNLSNASNVFGSGDAVFLSDVSNTTLDGSSGVSIGGTLGGSLFTSTVHGSLTAATTGEIDILSPISAHGSGSTDTAFVSLSSGTGAVSEDATNGSISTPVLAGSAGTSASFGAGNTIGMLAGFVTHDGDFLLVDATGVAVTGTVAATGGNASLIAAGDIRLGAPVSAATGTVTLDATTGAITDPGNTDGSRTDVTAASVTLLAGTGIGIPSGTSTAGTPLVLRSPAIAAVTDAGGIDLVNNTGTAAAAVSTLGVTSGPGDILFRQIGSGSLSIGSATDANGSIAVDVQGADLTLTDASAGAGGNITLGLGGIRNLTLNGTVTAGGGLLGKAEVNVNLDAAMLTSGGQTTLVVDDAFPAFGIGPGALTVTGATTISTATGDNLALFLARRSQVTLGSGASLTLNGQPFFDDPDAKFPDDQTVSFVHFGVHYSPTITPDAGEAFTLFFKEQLQIPPPDFFEEEVPLPKLDARSYPIAFAMLYQGSGQPVSVASLAAISPAAGGPRLGSSSGVDGILGYARISSYEVAPDTFSAIERPLYMDIQNPKTEEQLGYELRPTLQAPADGSSSPEALAGIHPSGGVFSCTLPPQTLALLSDNPELAQHLRDLCGQQGRRDLSEPPVRAVRYYRPAP
ncbi:MAG TPA: filamentous hemagglutinin N-terminal domain-containing protein [Stellaceae bacterium]|nr:filamentous hemagglutinin N-terminal domain-containing protein [Stellaceae bacterium]